MSNIIINNTTTLPTQSVKDWDPAWWGELKQCGKDWNPAWWKDLKQSAKEWDPSWWQELKSVKVTQSASACSDDCSCGSSAPASLAGAKNHTGRPLRILCLHGGGSSGKGFEGQLKQLREDLGPLVEFVCAQAPHAAPGIWNSSDEFLWMGDAQKQGPHSVDWWRDSVRYLEGVLAEQGPFDGLLGYSMGSAAAFSLLATLPEGTFRFAVLCCGYVPTNDKTIMAQLEQRRPMQTPTLHCFGREDFCIPEAYTAPMLQYFDPGVNEVLRHPGGHDVPRDARHVGQLAAFLMRFA